jgi:hypothetical protein
MLRPLLVCLTVLTLSSSAFAAPSTRPGGPRIRPQDPRTARFLKDGLRRSATMRGLAERIEASNVIVYVGIDPMMRSSLTGALSLVTASGDFRYVRAHISGGQIPDLMIATLAHEFQHVVEVIDHPSVVDDESLVTLYRRIGVAGNDRRHASWETMAARDVGAQVRRELGARTASGAAPASTDSTSGLDDEASVVGESVGRWLPQEQSPITRFRAPSVR